MISKNQIKFIHSLHLRKYRDLQRLFIAEGVKLVTDLLESRFSVSAIYYNPEKINDSLSVFLQSGVPLHEVNEDEMKRMSTLTSPSPVLALVKMPDELPVIHTTPCNLILVLDDIRDPGNMGTIIRIADWFGISHVIISMNSVDIYNPKVVQATMGSLARVKISQLPLTEYLSGLPENTPVYGTFLDGKNIYSETLECAGVIIMGNESNGISAPVAAFVNKRLSVPAWNPPGTGRHAESLNASVATALVCAEFRRRTQVR